MWTVNDIGSVHIIPMFVLGISSQDHPRPLNLKNLKSFLYSSLLYKQNAVIFRFKEDQTMQYHIAVNAILLVESDFASFLPVFPIFF